MRAPRVAVDVVAFIEGLMAVLALKGLTSFQSDVSVFSTALKETSDAIRPIADRHKVALSFRLPPHPSTSERSILGRALRQLETEGTLGRTGPHLELRLTQAAAYVMLEGLPAPVAFYEGAAKAFLRRHHIARIRTMHRAAPP